MQGESSKSDGFWSPTDDVSNDQLEQYWKGLPEHTRLQLLKVDKKTFLEKARMKMFCSRCYALLIKEFPHIINYKKSPQMNGDSADDCDAIDSWKCLAKARDGAQTLTLSKRYLSSTSLNLAVFENARTIETQRELLFPNACGIGGHRWKGPGSKEPCSVHTDLIILLEKLVEFWSSRGENYRQNLLKMKDEDFIEHLTFRFDDKKVCRDCRKNVLREFKELKELTSTRKESGFQYKISHDTVQADWSQTFMHTDGSYRQFEWGIGTAKGESDISAFKNVGLSKIVQVNGLDLSGLDACYITLRAWKTDGDCTELFVKARISVGQQYVHCSLVVGDGFVTLREGESIQNFFIHAGKLVKEDNNLVDGNGNRLDGVCSHPNKHVKSPELARKFLLDAATVFFKEQVDMAFRGWRAQRNLHGIFVSLALNIIEEQVQVACKERLVLDNQIKLLGEEMMEKKEEEERKERKRIKEREKKLRRKERTKNSDNCSLIEQHLAPEVHCEESKIVAEEPDAIETVKVMSSRPVSPRIQDEQQINEYMREDMHNSSDVIPDENFATSNDKDGSSGSDQLRYSELKLRNRYQLETSSECSINKESAVVPKSGIMVNKSGQIYHDDQFDTSSRTTSTQNKLSRSEKSIIRAGDMSEPSYPGNKFTRGGYIHDGQGRSKPNFSVENIPASRDSSQIKKVGGPSELQMKYIQSNSESDVTVRSSTLSGDAMEPYKPRETPGALCYDVGGQKTASVKGKDVVEKELKSPEPGKRNNGHSRFYLNKETCQYPKEAVDVSSDFTATKNPSISSTSSTDRFSSCLNKGSNNSPSSNPLVIKPLTTSISGDASPQSGGREASRSLQTGVRKCEEVVMDQKQIAYGGEPVRRSTLDRRSIRTSAESKQDHMQAQGIPEKPNPMQKQPNAASEGNLNSNISQTENKGFSFFHFGGPFALADAYKSDSSSKASVGGDLTCNKIDSIEEYNLFASNKVISFPIV